MGEVYLAEDETLHRKVALKVLPPGTANQPDRLSRFRREAESVAALSHPNIVTIFSVEEENGVHFLTMELVEGRTLDKVIPEGGLPLDKVLELAVPMADALAAAHEAGVVHRDLKPFNIMLDQRGHVRIMDFGLAKWELHGDATVSDAPTEGLTREGVQVGTVPYMSPEQVQGKRVDHRADIFAFGTVLYEMVTGRRLFPGKSGPDVMSAILRDDPEPVSRIRPSLPRRLDDILARCLRKDPKERFQSAAELRAELQSLADQTVSGPQTGTTPGFRGLHWLGVAIVVVAAATLVWWLNSRQEAPTSADTPSAAPSERRVSQLTFGAELEEWPAWSSDGKSLAYSAETGGFRKLFVRNVDTGDIRQLTEGFADDVQTAWSPDGSRLVFVRSSRDDGKIEPDDLFGSFFTGGDIWQLDLETGQVTRIIENAYAPAWSSDGRQLAFQADWAGPPRIWVTDSRGRNPRQVTTDSSEAVEHVEPVWSPDGLEIVYRRREKSKSDLQVVNVATGEVVWVTDDNYRDMHAQWSPSGDAIFFSSYRGGGQNIWRQPVGKDGSPSGPAVQLTTGAGNDVMLSVSPDGSRLTFTVLGINSDLWRLPLDPVTGQTVGNPEPLVSTTREDSRGSWSPDGSMLAFNSNRLGEMSIWLKPLDGGAERQLTTGAGGDFQPNWSPDGSRIVFFSSRDGNVDIWVVEVATGELIQLTDSPSVDEDPFCSPDGKHIAFQSDRDGRLEVWVMDADGSNQRQLSSIGTSGHFMRWVDDSSAVIHRTSSDSSSTNLYRQSLDGAPPEPLPEIAGGGYHISFSPDRHLILDVTGHKTIWTYPLDGGERTKVFEFEDPDIRVDYPVWSPDGRWVIFDRADYQGADIWLLEGLR